MEKEIWYVSEEFYKDYKSLLGDKGGQSLFSAFYELTKPEYPERVHHYYNIIKFLSEGTVENQTHNQELFIKTWSKIIDVKPESERPYVIYVDDSKTNKRTYGKVSYGTLHWVEDKKDATTFTNKLYEDYTSEIIKVEPYKY